MSYLRNKLRSAHRELAEASAQLPVALADGEDEVAIVLIERRRALATTIAERREQLESVARQARTTAAELEARGDLDDGTSIAAHLLALEGVCTSVAAELAESAALDDQLAVIRAVAARLSPADEVRVLRSRTDPDDDDGPGGAPAIKG